MNEFQSCVYEVLYMIDKSSCISCNAICDYW